jgi:hypothetical protein
MIVTHQFMIWRAATARKSLFHPKTHAVGASPSQRRLDPGIEPESSTRRRNRTCDLTNPKSQLMTLVMKPLSEQESDRGPRETSALSRNPTKIRKGRTS